MWDSYPETMRLKVEPHSPQSMEKIMSSDVKKIDAVFEGGGVKGIGLVGAVKTIEEQGYRFENLAGTSAGAIVASLLAAGYNADELKISLESQNFSDFMDKGWEDKIPLVGSLTSLIFEKGIYEGHVLEQWVRDLLAKKNVHTFGDLVIKENQDKPRYRYKLQVIASDITSGRMLVLPRDIEHFGIKPDDLEVARAVRMSMSLPFFFEPVQLIDQNTGMVHYIVDGGVLSNYPVWIYDSGSSEPAWPTFGFRLVEPEENQPHEVKGPVSMLKALFSTMMEAHDARYIASANFVRTIPIPTVGVKTTDFNLSDAKKVALYKSGMGAAAEFLETWDFEEYKQKFRTQQAPSRTEAIWDGKTT
jgi:NTE family protein